MNIQINDKLTFWNPIPLVDFSITIGLVHSIQKNKIEIHQLTKETALPILKKIALKSTLFSLVTKPIFVITAGAALLLLGGGLTTLACTTLAALPLLLISLPMVYVGVLLISYGIIYRDKLNLASKSFTIQKIEANIHLNSLKNLQQDEELTFSVI